MKSIIERIQRLQLLIKLNLMKNYILLAHTDLDHLSLRLHASKPLYIFTPYIPSFRSLQAYLVSYQSTTSSALILFLALTYTQVTWWFFIYSVVVWYVIYNFFNLQLYTINNVDKIFPKFDTQKFYSQFFGIRYFIKARVWMWTPLIRESFFFINSLSHWYTVLLNYLNAWDVKSWKINQMAIIKPIYHYIRWVDYTAFLRVFVSSPYVIVITRVFKFLQFISYLYKFVKTFLLSLLAAGLFFMYIIISLKITFLQHIAAWIVVGNIFFWLISGFNFFIKRGRFGKFTSALQRFWKRAFVCFWAVEGFLFALFFYYYLNSSQEPLYMYDRASLNNDFVLNLQSGFFSCFLLSSILLGCQILMSANNSRNYSQIIILLFGLTAAIFYLCYIEIYQIYYVLNGFNELVWVYDEIRGGWCVESDAIRLRHKQYYFLLCVVAKFWHFIFIFIAWVFFLLKSIELQKITYNHLSFNYQNLLILYVLNLLCYCNWIKFIFRRFFDTPYFWFFTDIDRKHLRIIADEVLHLILSIFNYNAAEINLPFDLITWI